MSAAKPSVADKRRAFRALHERGCFLLPNPWDVGSAVYLQSLGFKALATTSSGCAWSLGRSDGGVAVDDVIVHLQALVEATDVPINADFESGFAATLDGVAANVERAVRTGIAGLSIEDSTGDPESPLYSLSGAAARLRAARAAIDRVDASTLLIGRAEGFLVGRNDIGEIIERLRAYAEAGADCLYAPGAQSEEHITAIVGAVAPKPVNVLIHSRTHVSLADMARLGVRRVSVGGALAKTAWAGFILAARTLAAGRFDGLIAPSENLDDVFAKIRAPS